jgi:hypothetical protein
VGKDEGDPVLCIEVLAGNDIDGSDGFERMGDPTRLPDPRTLGRWAWCRLVSL